MQPVRANASLELCNLKVIERAAVRSSLLNLTCGKLSKCLEEKRKEGKMCLKSCWNDSRPVLFSSCSSYIQPTVKLSREGELYSQINALCRQWSHLATAGMVSPLSRDFLYNKVSRLLIYRTPAPSTVICSLNLGVLNSMIWSNYITGSVLTHCGQGPFPLQNWTTQPVTRVFIKTTAPIMNHFKKKGIWFTHAQMIDSKEAFP